MATTYLEGQPWRDSILGTRGVVECAIRTRHELAAHREVSLVGDPRSPERKAVWISIIAALVLRRPIQETMVVHLLARIILVDIGSVSLYLVNAVLDTENAARHWVLGNTDAVTQAPA